MNWEGSMEEINKVKELIEQKVCFGTTALPCVYHLT